VHADQHALVFQPGSRDFLINANDGGVFLTPNARDSIPCWRERNESFNTMQFYTAAMAPGKGIQHFLGGTQDNSTMLYEGIPVTDDGNRYLGGDGAYCFVDSDQPEVHIMSTQWNSYAVSPGLEDTLIDYSELFKSGLFVNPVDYDSRSNTLMGNAALQHGEHLDYIIIIKNIPWFPAGTFRPVYSGALTPFSAVRISPHSEDPKPALFLGTQSGRVFKVRDIYDASIHSIEIGSPQFPPANVSCIQVGNSEAEILITFSNYGVPSVWLTHDGGENWENKEGNLPDIPVRWSIWHPDNRRHVLLATEVGIWSCEDILVENPVWKPELEGLANVRVDMLQYRESDHTVLAGTHGRGMYTGTWEVESDSVEVLPYRRGYIKVFPNPTDGNVTIQYSLDKDERIDVEIFNRIGQKVKETGFNSYTGQFEQVLDLSELNTGTYILRIHIWGEIRTHRVILVRPEDR
jgi:hypothetical protein